MRGAQGGMDTGWGEGEAQEPGREKGGECMVTESGNARRLEMLRFQKFRLLKSQNIRIPESKKPRIFELGSVRSGSPPALQGKTHIFHSTPPHLRKWPPVLAWDAFPSLLHPNCVQDSPLLQDGFSSRDFSLLWAPPALTPHSLTVAFSSEQGLYFLPLAPPQLNLPQAQGTLL